jgi:acyl-CoA thioesterase-1
MRSDLGRGSAVSRPSRDAGTLPPVRRFGVVLLAVVVAAPVLEGLLEVDTLLAADGGTPLVVCLGDSLTEGYQVEPEHAYPAIVESRLADRGWPDIEVVNAGISGSTTASAVSRLRWQLRRKPDVLVLALGANDGLRGIAPETTKINLAAAIDLAKTEGLIVLLAGMKLPPNYGTEHTEAFERIFVDLAADNGVALIPFLLDGVATDPELNLPDGIHPTARGYSIVADTVIEYLVPLLGLAEAGAADAPPAGSPRDDEPGSTGR